MNQEMVLLPRGSGRPIWCAFWQCEAVWPHFHGWRCHGFTDWIEVSASTNHAIF